MRYVLALCLALTCAQILSAATADSIVGTWVTTDGKGHVQIVKDGDTFSGKIVWLAEPNYTAGDSEGTVGTPKIDHNNPAPELRKRPILGLPLLHGFTYSGENVWEKGMIYDPENGKLYKCKLTLISPNQLEVRGFIGFSLLGRTVVWTRAPAK